METLENDERVLAAFEEELKVWQRISHPNIMRVNEVLLDERNYYFDCELLTGGNLEDRIATRPEYGYQEENCAQVMKQVLLAVNFLHKSKIAHRDLKPANILLGKRAEGEPLSWEAKLADFGFACTFERRMKQKLGTALYKAPELLVDGKYD